MPLPVLLLGSLAVAMAGVFAVGLSAAGRDGRGRWLAVGLGVAAVYLGVSAGLAASGALADVDARPPPAGAMLLAMGAGTVALALSRELGSGSLVSGNAYASRFESTADLGDGKGYGASAAYSRAISEKLSARAAAAIDVFESDFTAEDFAAATALLGLRYNF